MLFHKFLLDLDGSLLGRGLGGGLLCVFHPHRRLRTLAAGSLEAHEALHHLRVVGKALRRGKGG